MNQLYRIRNSTICIIMLILTLFIANNSIAQTQNPYWVFNGSYVNINNGTVSSLPTSYLSKTFSANGIFDNSGALRFYGATNPGDVNLAFKDKNGHLRNIPYKMSNELVIFPAPNSCNNYYTIFNDISGVIGGQKDFTYAKLSFDPSTGLSDGMDITYMQTFKDINVGIAVSVNRLDERGTSANTKVYLVGDIDTYKGHIYSFTFDETGMVAGPTDLYSWAGSFATTELELSHDGNLLAWGTYAPLQGAMFCIYNVNSNQLYTQNFVDGTTHIPGVEFSQAGDRLFFTKKGGDIQYVSVSSNGSMGSPTSVIGSSGLGNSQIELGSDGYMYVSDGNFLRKFDPNASAPTISSSTIAVTNPLTGTNGIYTLVDQIDGGDYSKPYKTYACLPNKTFSNSSLSSTVVSSFIKSINAVTVPIGTTVSLMAGDFIEFNPGFTADGISNTIFNANIAACTGDINPSCALKKGSFEDESSSNLSIENKRELILVTPNPTSGFFSIQIDKDVLIKEIGIYDALGNRLKDISPDMLEVDLSDYPSGIYLIKAVTNNKVLSQKIIKN